MISLFKSRPMSQPKERRRIIWAASRFFLFGSFALSFSVSAVFWMIESWNAQRFSQLADVLLAPLYWLFSLGFILPALAIAWPCANIALRLGYASWATAIVACSILLTLLLVMGFYPTVTPLIVIIGIASGVGFGTLYWFGAYRKFPNAFDPQYPDSN